MTINLTCENLNLKYGKFEALKEINFTLTKGIYGLIGRNGAGKTSLLSLLASFRRPTSGYVTVNGEEVFENPQLMSKVSFIYNTVDFDYESKNSMEQFKAIAHYNDAFDIGYATKLAKQFKLPLDKPLSGFSRGMHAAFGVISGLASHSPITIFDEVYLSMDAPTRELFYQELLSAQRKHPRIFILSTHLISEMEYLFDHVLIIDQGKLIINEPYDEVVSRGSSATGEKSKIDQFVKGMTVLNTKQLGNTKSVMVYNQLSDEQRDEAERLDLEIGQLSLHELFIHLTKEENNE